MSETCKAVEKGIYKRGEMSFQVKMMVGGLKLSETFDTLEEARAWRDSKRASKSLDPDFKKVVAAQVKKRDINTFTLESALLRYKTEVTAHKKGKVEEEYRIAKLRRFSLAKQSMYRIGPDEVLTFLNELGQGLSDDGQKHRPCSENNKRKYASLISSVFNIARKRWRYAVENPIQSIELPSNGKPRKRRFEEGEEEAINQALQKESVAMRAFITVAIETASRRGELLKLDWKNVKLGKTSGTAVHVDPKNGEDRVIPLSKAACDALRTLPRPIKGGPVFGALTVHDIRGAWDRVRTAAGCPDLRLHDLRHEGVSRLFELGLDRIEAATISGHKTLQMLKDYTHLRAEKLANKINAAKKQAS